MQAFKSVIDEKDGYLRLTLSGPSSRGGLIRALTEVIAAAKSRQIWRVLCDATAVPHPVSMSEKYDVGTELARTADQRMVFAVVARSELIDHFFETVARDRGASVRVFVNEATALQWLFSRSSGGAFAV
jgi:hypothetical protein